MISPRYPRSLWDQEEVLIQFKLYTEIMNIFMLEILNLHRVSFVILASLSWIDLGVNKVKKLFAVQDVTNVIFTEAALGIVENVKNLI